MILINVKKDKYLTNVWPAEASRLMGISTKQISRWIKHNKEPFEVFNDWTLYFKEDRIKRKTGFALK